MMYYLPAILLTITLFTSTGLHSQDLEQRDLQAILYAQDQRDARALEGLMRSQHDAVRFRAVLASASVQDTALLPTLISLLEDPSPEVRRSASLSVGQLTGVVSEAQRSLLSSVLLKRLSFESNEAVLLRIVEAIGKAGNAEALNVMDRVAKNLSKPVRAEVALSIGRFGYRTIRSTEGTALAAKGLSESTGETWKYAYALMRIGVDSLLRPFLNDMKKAFDSGDADARMFLATALGAAKSPDAVDLLTKAAWSDHDWRVRVSATRALGVAGKADLRAAKAMLQLSLDTNEHVALTALSTLRSMDTSVTTRQVLNAVLGRTDESTSVRQRGEAAKTLASLFPGGSTAQLEEAYASEAIPGEVYAECLGSFDDPGSFERILDLTNSTDVPVSRVALNALDAVVRRNPDPLKRQMAREAFVSSVRSNDMTLIVTGSGALGDTLYADSTTDALLLYRLKTFSLPRDAEAMGAIIQALGALKSREAVSPLEALLGSSDPAIAIEAAKSLVLITGESYSGRLPAYRPLHTDYDWEFLKSLEGATVEVQTSAGAFSFEMLPADAPLTCVNFARLIGTELFNGLPFHRVVPNFVIQGGDPRGDGWGGPGYSIRSEFGLQSYETGMVGVASSGKDTEGCQFFVTHSKQPHLDGRYTIFGRIVSGMEVVDKIQVGDMIEGVTIRTRNAEGGSRK